MKKYDVKVRFIADYLQARFSERAQDNLKVKAGSKAGNSDDDAMVKDFSYIDEEKKQYYIPSMQIKQCLVNGGKSTKKKPFGSFKDIVKAFMFVEEDKIFLKKEKPDFVKTSYPSRKDGMRVKVCHPAFKPGFEISFTIICTNDDIDDKTIKMITEKGGLEYGIGAWRPENGRFEVLEFNKQ